jgi:hypothetical protein
LVAGSKYYLKAKITNLGQNILDATDGFKLKVEYNQNDFQIKSNSVPTLEPNQNGDISLFLNTPKSPGSYDINVYIGRNSDWSQIETEKVLIIPSPSVNLTVQLGWKSDIKAQNVTLLIYDNQEFLIHKITGLSLHSHNLLINNLHNIIPGHKYRIVLLVPNYLPRQTVVKITDSQNNLGLSRLYPLDLDGNGKFTINDVWMMITKSPYHILSLSI